MSSEENNNKGKFLDKVIIALVIISCISIIIRIIRPEIIININNKINSFIPDNYSNKNDKFDKGEWIVVEDEMSKPRSPATANLLPDGNVLIMGGEDRSADTADIYSPEQNKIIKTIQLDDKRLFGYSATNLDDGQVLIAGGFVYEEDVRYLPKQTNTAKLFDSKTYEFKNIKPMPETTSGHLAVSLKNKNVLILTRGGLPHKDIVYNSESQDWSYTENEREGNVYYTFSKENGDIIVKGAINEQHLYIINENQYKIIPYQEFGSINIQLNNSEYLSISLEKTYSEGFIYNFITNEKIPVKNKIPRTWRPGIFPQAVLLENGNVLILGISLKNSSDEYYLKGYAKRTAKYSAYIYDRKENKFYEVPAPPYPVYKAGIVKLKNGDILVAGGLIKYNQFSNKIQIFKYKH